MSENTTPQFSNHRTCDALSGFTADVLRLRPKDARQRDFAKSARIWSPLDRADRMYFVEHGRVIVTSEDRGVIVMMARAGEPFGELCFCSAENGRRHSIAIAETDVRVVELTYRDLVELLQTTPGALDRLLFTVCVRLADAEYRLGVLAHRGAEQRLGWLLLHLAAARRSQGAIPPAAPVHELRVTHDELARLAAMNRSHVSVTIGKLRRHGLLRYSRKGPLVVDALALATYLMGSSSELS